MLTSRRADARQNRQVILQVAEEAFTTGSRVAPLAEIARLAGLGRATVYRHFPDRLALGTAVAERQLTTLRQVIDAAGEDCSFRDLLHLVLSEQVSKRPLVQLMGELPTRDQQRYVDALIAALTPSFRRAQSEGQLRNDLVPTDLRHLIDMIEATVGPAESGYDAATQRLIAIVLDGLCAPSASGKGATA